MMKSYKLYHGDCLELIKKLDSESITAVVTDGPYHLKATNNSKGGFMNAVWDSGDISFNPELWRDVYRCLKPGGYVLAFGSPRTFHKLACALEDSKFIIQNVISWLFATGFPHGMAIGKALEKQHRGHPQGTSDPTSPNHGRYKSGQGMGNGPGRYMAENGVEDDGELLCDDARKWSSYNTELKPSWEPIIMAMKPVDKNYCNNAIVHGVSGLNVGACRIATNDNLNGGAYCENKKDDNKWGTMHKYAGGEYKQPTGRYPSNTILSHDLNCQYHGQQKTSDEEIEVWDCVEDCPVRMLNEQTAHLKGGSFVGKNRNPEATANKIYGKYHKDTKDVCYGDSGSASRFYYCAKPSRNEKSNGCENLYWKKVDRKFEPISKDEWLLLPEQERDQGNIHLTVKSLDLMRYLVKLVKMPGDNIILDPFCGSGSTLVACKQLGVNAIGFDMELSSIIIAEARLSIL